jgi:general secretion pathway protein I
MKSRVSSPRAFTLIEVLVSLAIFALATVALSAAYLNVLGGYKNRDRERAINEAWSLVRIAALSEGDREKLESGGTFEVPGNRRLTWTARVEPTTLADLFAIELSVRSPAPDEWERTARIMVYRSAWSDPAERDRLRNDSRQRLERSRQ